MFADNFAPAGWAPCRLFVGAAMLLSFAGCGRRIAWSGDSGGNVSAFGDRGRHNGAGQHGSDFERGV